MLGLISAHWWDFDGTSQWRQPSGQQRELFAGCWAPDSPVFWSSHLEFQLSFGLMGTIQWLSPWCYSNSFNKSHDSTHQNFSIDNLHPGPWLAHMALLCKWGRGGRPFLLGSQRKGNTNCIFIKFRENVRAGEETRLPSSSGHTSTMKQERDFSTITFFRYLAQVQDIAC